MHFCDFFLLVFHHILIPPVFFYEIQIEFAVKLLSNPTDVVVAV